jgi:hypothetical protein
MKIVFKSAAVGMGAAIAACVLSLACARFFDAVGMYIRPSGLLIPIIGENTPPAILRWFIPNGPVGGVLLILVCSLLFWTLIFGAICFAWLKLRRKHA